jgi:O-methyltransferase
MQRELLRSQLPRMIAMARRHTGLPNCRHVNVAERICDCVELGINGCFMECGVQYGGTVCLMKTIAKFLNSKENVYAFDSFEGLPVPCQEDVAVDGSDAYKMFQNGQVYEQCIVPIDRYRKTEQDFGLSGELIVKKGWFKDTLKDFPEKIAVLRADGDWLESTNDILNNLYDKVVPGGFIIFDDYGYWKGCKKAVDNFLERRNIKVDMNMTDSEELWFKKP